MAAEQRHSSTSGAGFGRYRAFAPLPAALQRRCRHAGQPGDNSPNDDKQ